MFALKILCVCSTVLAQQSLGKTLYGTISRFQWIFIYTCTSHYPKGLLFGCKALGLESYDFDKIYTQHLYIRLIETNCTSASLIDFFCFAEQRVVKSLSFFSEPY